MLFAHNNKLTVGKTELPIILLNLHRFSFRREERHRLSNRNVFCYFDPEDEDSNILRNVGSHAPTYTALYLSYITTAVTSSDLADKMGFNCKQSEIVMLPHGKNVNMELLLLLLLLLFFPLLSLQPIVGLYFAVL